MGMSAVGGSRRQGNAQFMHRTQIDDTATISKMSHYASIDGGQKKINSINGIEPSLRNVDRLFRVACKKTKDGFT